MKFVKRFESIYGNFEEKDISLERMLYLICVANDDCVYDAPGPEIAHHELYEGDFPILNSIMDDNNSDFLMVDISENIGETIKKLSDKEKNNIKELYHKLNKTYRLEKFITIDDIKELTYDLVDSGFELEWKIWCAKFKTPSGYFSSLKNFPTTEIDIKFSCDEELDKYFTMSEDIQTLIERLRDNYQVDFRIFPLKDTYKPMISYKITISDKD